MVLIWTSPNPTFYNFQSTSASLFPSQAEEANTWPNTQPDNPQLCLLNNKGIMLFNPEGFMNSYKNDNKSDLLSDGIKILVQNITIANHRSQTHNSDQCFVYFPG